MDFDITDIRRKYTPLRNGYPEDSPFRQLLTNILNMADLINKTPPGPYRDELLAAFPKERAKYAAATLPTDLSPDDVKALFSMPDDDDRMHMRGAE